MHYEPSQKLSAIAVHECRLSKIIEDKYFDNSLGQEYHPKTDF